MKKLLFTCIVVGLLISCSEENDTACNCSDLNLDLAISIGYSKDSVYADVCVNDASSNVPANSIIKITNSYSANCALYYKNGTFETTLSIILPDGTKCSKTEQFVIKGLR